MPSIVTIDKNCDKKESSFKALSVCELYKKCNYRKVDEAFQECCRWNIRYKKTAYTISIYGKNTGRAGTENKFELPPPFDSLLLFGTIAVVNLLPDGSIGEISEELWNVLYEKLYGGFENLDDTAVDDENEVDELNNIDDSEKTKTGYLKDGFIVDDPVIENDDTTSDDETVSDEESQSGETDSEDESDADVIEVLKQQTYVFSDDEDDDE